MEATIVAAFIKAASSLITTLIQVWSKKKAGDSDQGKVNKWVEKNYSTLYLTITEDSVKILKLVEMSRRYTPSTFLSKLYPKLSMSSNNRKKFENVFVYHLEYLAFLGMLAPATTNAYGISRLGVAFLSAARARGHFPDVLGV